MKRSRVSPALLCAVLFFSLLCGCAAPQRLAPLRSGESVDFVVTRSPQADAAAKIRNQDMGHDTSVGAGSGMALGVLSSLGCGPWAFVCIPAGLLVGGLTGTAAGAAVGLTGSLSDEKAAQIRERLSRAQRSHDLLDDLRNNIGERARRRWTLGPDPSATMVTVELQEQSLTSTRDERIGLVVRVLVTVKPHDTQPPSPPTRKLYEYIGPLGALTAWLDENSDFLETSLNSASQQIAAQIVSDLSPN